MRVVTCRQRAHREVRRDQWDHAVALLTMPIATNLQAFVVRGPLHLLCHRNNVCWLMDQTVSASNGESTGTQLSVAANCAPASSWNERSAAECGALHRGLP